MKSQIQAQPTQSPVDDFLRKVRQLSGLRVSGRYRDLLLEEYPFDHQLLTVSRLYRKSRSLYLSMGGGYVYRLSSTMRSLSTHDLFKNEIEFTPAQTELFWFRDHHDDVVDPENEMNALIRFSDISVFHEQNHRIIWKLLPPVPPAERDVNRYLNFAESLVATLDMALGDDIGHKFSPLFESVKVIYRAGGFDQWSQKSKSDYNRYLIALFCSTYLLLELVHEDDILKAVDYILPGQKKMNKSAVYRSLELSELFTKITNPQWQERHWESAQAKLEVIHQESEADPFFLPKDPLDLDTHLTVATRIFRHFGL